MLTKFVCDAALERGVQVHNHLATILTFVLNLKMGTYYIIPLAGKHGMIRYKATGGFYLSHFV
jgi:hypothetical protein